jgi:hypothetical protein
LYCVILLQYSMTGTQSMSNINVRYEMTRKITASPLHANIFL